jgi:hypothetical protein
MGLPFNVYWYKVVVCVSVSKPPCDLPNRLPFRAIV